MSNSSLLRRLGKPLLQPFAEFFQREASGGIILLLSSIVALLLANTDVGIGRYFPAIWENHFSIAVGSFQLEKSLSHWVNDGLMALFFLIVGLEIKREVLEGELASVQQAVLPMVGALGGMVLPAGLFWLVNQGTPTAGGWGIPMATDIAFALAIVNLLGNRVPLSLKVFLTALAIVDDLGAVLVIAVFYTQSIAVDYLIGAGLVWVGLLVLNRLGVRVLGVYLLLGLVLWYLTLKSGIHATIAGVLLAMAIPFRTRLTDRAAVQQRLNTIQTMVGTQSCIARDVSEELESLSEEISSPSQRLEQVLHSPVAFFIIPFFAFCNTSIAIDLSTLGQLTEPLALGVMAGLLVGKPAGVFLLCYGTVRLGWATLPADVRWSQLLGVSILAGIGFTMSIFITLLAFDGQPALQDSAKIAILLASLVAGLAGYGLLRRVS
ncbi:NhaA family Na+:H+ antiporter [Spirosoma lacussanchae]|uniref:Na+/H+ antiporter NhaA n=1 Tax=Spirosoma lacussanchae TaxID=1884249 RepID=UPI001108C683|nr:Na+/H+ antiporter NhaA [Spirosoma lacussanchae]